MHIRQQIREAVAAALLTATVFGQRVHTAQPPRLQHPIAPTAVVLTSSEDIERDGVLGIYRQQRSISVDIHLIVEDASAVADVLDAAAEAAEIALASAGTLDGLLDAELELAETRTDIDDSGATPVGELRMTYLAHTTVLASAPGARA